MKKTYKIPAELRRLVLKIQKVKKQAERLGVFTCDRELLRCPKCRLEEDVAGGTGLLFVTRPSNREKDTGLRFDVNRKTRRAKCPDCNRIFAWKE